MSDETINNYGAFIWSVADLLRGVYKQSEYGRVILPLTVLRRLDCVLEPTKEAVLERAEKLPATLENRGPVLEHIAGPVVLQHVEAHLQDAAGRLRQHRRAPAQLHRRLLRIGPRHHREVQLRHPDRPVERPQLAVPGGFEVRRPRHEPRHPLQPGDGLHIRGVDPPLLGAVQRDGGGALHPPRGDPADGQLAVRGRRRTAHSDQGS